MAATTVDIPPELWQLIAFYLTEDEVWALRGSNRVLSDLAWDRRCYRIPFPITVKSLSARDLKHLERPFIAGRIRDILISDDLCRAFFLDRIFAREIPRGQFSAFSKQIRGLLEESDPFKRLTPMLCHVSSIQVHWPLWFSNAFTKRALLAIEQYSEKLRFLTISHDPKPTTMLLKGTHLPQLESFTLLPHFRMHHFEWSTTLNETILPFLARHHKTLKSFHLPRGNTINTCYPGSLQMPSDNIPLFKTLTITFWFLPIGMCQGVHDFIASQSQSLNSLTLFVCTQHRVAPAELLQSPLVCPNLNLPHLTHLIFEHVRSSGQDDAIIFFQLANSIALACSRTLIRLEIRGGYLEYDTEVMLYEVKWGNLKLLGLSIYRLCALDLDLLSNHNIFPKLEELHLIEIQKFTGSKSSSFEADLLRREYNQSKLRYLEAKTPLNGQIANFKALVNAFPKLLLFNDIPRSQFLEI